MARRNLLFLLLILTLCLLSACSSPTVKYFPVRSESDPRPIFLLLNYGKLSLEDGLLCFKSLGSDVSYLVIWPPGYSYQASGARITVIDSAGQVVAKSGQLIEIGGGPAYSSVESYTGQPSPVPLPGPAWVLGAGSIKHLYPWDTAFRGIMVLFGLLLVVIFTVIWLVIRRRRRTNR